MFVVNCALKVLIECHRGARFPTYFDWVTSLILPPSEGTVPHHTEANPNQWTPQDAHSFMMLLPATRPNIDSSLSTSLWYRTDQSEWFTRTSHRIPQCPVSSVRSTLCRVPSATASASASALAVAAQRSSHYLWSLRNSVCLANWCGRQ